MIHPLALAAPVVLALLGVPNLAHAFDGYEGYWGYGSPYWGYGNEDINNDNYSYGNYGGSDQYQSPYDEATSDYQSDLSYNPYPACCHSYAYTHGFSQGYYQTWLSLQQTQTNTQGIDNRMVIATEIASG
jgi:tetratricopeptide (TPR) repeat protein